MDELDNAKRELEKHLPLIGGKPGGTLEEWVDAHTTPEHRAWWAGLSPEEVEDVLALSRQKFEVFIVETLEQYDRDKVDPEIIASVKATLAQWHEMNIRDAVRTAERRAAAGKKPQ